jgi:hypothetical protein
MMHEAKKKSRYGPINEQQEVLFLLLFLVGGGPTVAAR